MKNGLLLTLIAVALGCSRGNDERANNQSVSSSKNTVADSQITAPVPAPVSLSMPENTIPVSLNLYNKTEETWDNLRTNEEKYIGKTVHLERLKVMSSRDDIIAYTRNSHYVTITGSMGSYEFERGMHTPNFVKVHEDDWLDVTGTFKGINSSGELVIEMKKLKNLGFHPED